MSRKKATAPSRFVDAALARSPSYHPDRKWLVRRDLLGLLRDFPFLSPCSSPLPTSPAVHLLAATGDLPLPSPLHLAIFLHPDHPHHPPFLFLLPPLPAGRHPFLLDASTGLAATPYLLNWRHPGSTLPGLVHNLLRIFAPQQAGIPTAAPSRREALDRLAILLLSDLASLRAAAEEDACALRDLRSRLSRRGAALEDSARELDREAAALRAAVGEAAAAAGDADAWVRLHTAATAELDGSVWAEEAFEVPDMGSEVALRAASADLAADDVLLALDRALGRGTVGLEEYLTATRATAKEQFYHRKETLPPVL